MNAPDDPISHPGLTRARQTLARAFGHREFLPGQEAALASILSGRDLLVVMPTGSGKSLLYQLPALLDDGLTLVVSPLIALMKDQVDELTRKGVAAAYINSSLSPDEQRERIARCRSGQVKLLYVAPERFRNQGFLSALNGVRFARMAVDEAHCISQWGHDFRPDYLKLKQFRELLGRPAVTALTATATPKVRDDIIRALGLSADAVDVHVHGFDRPNLILEVREVFSPAEKLSFVSSLLKKDPGAGIIYTGTRKAADELAQSLKTIEPGVVVYHAGMDPEARGKAQEEFLSGRARVVAATTAFGMGIDKSDIRFVVHYSYPGSIEQYYQEIGRAGRDGLPSRCVLLYAASDRMLREFFIDLNYPGRDKVRMVYEALWSIPDNPIQLTYRQLAGRCGEGVKDGHVGAAVRLLDEARVTRALTGEPLVAISLDRPGAEVLAKTKGPNRRRVLEALSATVDLELFGRYEVSLSELAQTSGLDDDRVRRALADLHDSGLIRYEPAFRGRGVEKLTAKAPPFGQLEIDWKRQDLLRGLEEEKLAAMESFIHSETCRRERVLHYFGEEQSFTCGTCDRCAGKDEREGASALQRWPEIALPLLVCVRHLRFPLGELRLCKVVNGSRDKNLLQWGLNQNPAYNTVQADPEHVRRVIRDLIREGYLKTEQGEKGPTIVITEWGEKAAASADLKALKAAPPLKTPARTGPGADDDDEAGDGEIKTWALRCAASLDPPMGMRRIIEVLTGSKAKWIMETGADQLEAYGAVTARRIEIEKNIGRMLRDGWLTKGGNSQYPVLELTDAGRRRLAGPSEPEAPTPPAKAAAPAAVPETPPEAKPKTPATGASALLGQLLESILTAPPEQAKAMTPELSLFHPRELATRIETAFDSSGDARSRARAVWAMGELAGPWGFDFLVRQTASPEQNLRRLAASALGKAAAETNPQDLANVRQALNRLLDDEAPQVRQYAQKSLEKLTDG